MDINNIRELVKLFKEEGLTRLKVEDGDVKIHIEESAGETAVMPKEQSTESDGAGGSSSDSGLTEIKAPQVGTFYLQKEEGSDENFVNPGDRVEAGDQIGIIEAMKVFNDVTTEHAGVIEEVRVENGDSVEYDQVLMTLREEGE
ncbi:acetyl-CoA carboxylase biotin carboxyl carrier protein [Lacicoccus alkaliphilus]|uniref:Acetyl-CoA carboxylase biotin carboxyl carrier protein n=1 Tax=Lacicoccus alkaliphilus DSM 16010 TaxID=1123231 RepID=A0A1M7DZZ5_9BACL|nr:acetyl-CoA carboxylase biotin carboxyl carrier protein subunit [Salinicoccus alkaliphilus]SHL85054.1 acetyl-CoA carboxylase biotin carboxyl carrier protein [Salinicoccus alkaliphilus DSM 16010]